MVAGQPVLVATHYEDDHSWGFLDGAAPSTANALVVAMSTVVDRHPDIQEIAGLPPGWSATRAAVGESWTRRQNDRSQDE